MPAQPDPKREKAIFESALELNSPAERAAYLNGACGGDPALLKRLEALIAAHEGQPSFLPGGGSAEAIPTSIEGGRFAEEAGSVIGRYKLLEKLGEGGFGSVWAAEQREPVKRRVALKIIKLGMDTQQVVARFEAERQALALMDHPNIARVLDAGATDTGRPYFVMELVKGVPITKHCDRGRLGTRDRLDLFIKVCQAIQHAHQKGIIHRDIKPSNILVTLHDGVPVPKVIDFGIAKATQQELTELTIYTQHHQFIGTPAYMSPEQAEMSGLDIDTRSDIYSLGVLLYELLTGTTPFDTKELLQSGLDEMRKIIREREPVRPSTRLIQTRSSMAVTDSSQPQSGNRKPEIDSDLDWIVMKCLEKDRARRYETANGLAADLKRYLGNEPVTARPPSAAYRLRKAWRRNRVAFAAAALVTVALVAGITISTWQAVVAKRARDEALAAQVRENEQKLAAQEEGRKARAAEAREAAERRTTERNLYVAKMNNAQQAWEEGNVRRVRELLSETADSPHRGFEWFFWQRMTHLESRTLRGHLEPVTAIAFSPDGTRIVTCSEDHTFVTWDVATGMLLHRGEGHTGPVRAVTFTPDGRRIVTCSDDWTARIWDSASGGVVFVLDRNRGAILCAAMSPDGARLATGSEDRSAEVWDATTGQHLYTLEGHSGAVTSLAYGSEGRHIVTGSSDGTVAIWDAQNGTNVMKAGANGWISSVAVSPDSRTLAAGIAGQSVVLWDAASLQPRLRFDAHVTWKSPLQSGVPLPVAFSPDGQRLVTGSLDHLARVWDAGTGSNLATLKGHEGEVLCVAISPDGRRIATGSADHTAKIWSATGPAQPLTLTGHSMDGPAVAFFPDSQRLITGSFDSTIRIWDLQAGRSSPPLTGHEKEVWAIAVSPDGKRFVSAGQDGIARVWDAHRGAVLLAFTNHAAPIWGAALSPDGRRIASGDGRGLGLVWDASTGEVLLRLAGHGARITGAAFSPDGSRIVTAAEDATAIVWDSATGAAICVFKEHSDTIRSVAFSPDSKRVVTGGWDRTPLVWEADTGRVRLRLRGHRDQVVTVAFSPDGSRILTGGFDQQTRVWDAVTGQELLRVKDCIGVAFAPDGQRLSAVLDPTGAARVWGIASDGQIAGWREEEQRDLDLIAALEREREQIRRMQRPGSIRDWLVLLPIEFSGRDGSRALRDPQLAQQAALRPRRGERVQVGSGELVWTPVHQEGELLDFAGLAGTRKEWALAYAVAYIRCDAGGGRALLLVRTDDQCSVHLNGNIVFEERRAQRVTQTERAVCVELREGWNVLVLKVVNEALDWRSSIRLTSVDGGPLPGLSTTLDPEVMERR